MNKILKKVLATLSCAVIIGQIMLTSVVGATGKSYDKNQITIPVETQTPNTTDEGASDTDKDNDNPNTNTETNTNSETKPTDNTTNGDNGDGPNAGDVANPGHEGGESGNDSGSTSDNTCNSEIKLAFMESLTEIINNEISNSDNKDFKRAEVSIEDNAIFLYVENENVKLPKLSNYRTSLVNYILEKGEYGFVSELVAENEGLDIDISNIVNLNNIELGISNIVNVDIKDCHYSFYLELKIDNSSSNGNNNGNNGNGYSGRGKSSNGGSNSDNNSDNSKNINNSNDESLTLSGEVADEIMEVKKAESCSIEGSTYSEEQNQAYLWACDKGIVIADNIMKADMNKNITRAELAKMMSVYSEELLGRTRIKNIGVSYPDVDSSLEDLEYYVKEGYRLQIMGIHADGSALSKFSPNSLVTRGEFGTVFSRVLHGSIHNIGNSHYYEKHLKVLKDEGILTNINPKLIEKRGWILLMLHRSQKVEASNGNISNEEIADTAAEKGNNKN